MNWEYIAGLFDGDGHCNLVFKKNKKKNKITWSVSPRFVIAISGKCIEPMKEFLIDNNINVTGQTFYNHYGKTFYLIITSWNSVEMLIKNLILKVYIKEEQLKLLNEAIKLRKYIKENKILMIDNLKKFDEIRYKIHSYAKKGRKELKKYNF